MLLEAGLLTEEQRRDALMAQKGSNLRLGQFLVRKGIVSETQVIGVISEQVKVDKYHPDKYPVDHTLAKVIPEDVARKHQVIPLRKKGNLLRCLHH